MRTVSRFLICSFVVITIGACASARVPVHNFSEVPIKTKTNPTLDEVGKTIVKGGVAAGWQMSEMRPGVMIGTYKVRSHTAVVDVTYSTSAYNIIFKTGDEGLKYEGGTIHQNYNAWVENLELLIRTHLEAL
jgi:hypothetical protein